MASSDSTQHLGYAIARWLREPSVRSASSVPASELDSAAATIAKAFGASPDSTADKAKYGSGPGLDQVFDIFLKTQKKMGGAAAPAAGAATSGSKPSEADIAEAETLKAQGNKLMSSKDYGGAIEAYTKACDLNPTNPVYFSNRSAAYAQIGQHDKAIEDAREAAQVDPKFGKAYSRLGHALFSSGRYAEAVEAYEQGLKVDPTNALMKSGLETAKAHAGAPSGSGSSGAESDSVSRDAAPGGAQDPFAGFGGAGGMPDLAGLMNNPMIAQMAQQMMQNGGLEQLMNNPMIRNMMQGMGGPGGGMPDINALMQNPQMREMARNLMGGMGGGAGGAGGAGGTGAGRGAGGQGGSSDGPSDMYS